MPAVRELTVSLPKEHSELIDQLVESGSYESASEVVKAGLNSLREYGHAVERWLRDEVAPTCEEIAANPDRVVSAEEVRESLRMLYLEARKAGK